MLFRLMSGILRAKTSAHPAPISSVSVSSRVSRAARTIGFAATLATSLAALAVPANASYTLTWLSGTNALGINSTGVIVGINGSGASGLYWTPSGTPVTYSSTSIGGYPNSINDSGFIAGGAPASLSGLPSIYSPVSATWSPLYGEGYYGETVTDLGVGPNAISNNVNSLGAYIVAGTGEYPPAGAVSSVPVPYWNGDSSGSYYLPVLGAPPSTSDEGNAWGINDSYVICGDKQPPSGVSFQAFYWDGSLHYIPFLGNGYVSRATAISYGGSIVGFSNNNTPAHHGGFTHGFYYASSTLTDLGVLATGTVSAAYGISRVGGTDTVVGYGTVTISSTTYSHAMIWDATNGMRDLNGLVTLASGDYLEQANGINSSGVIVGYGIHNGSQAAFVIQP